MAQIHNGLATGSNGQSLIKCLETTTNLYPRIVVLRVEAAYAGPVAADLAFAAESYMMMTGIINRIDGLGAMSQLLFEILHILLIATANDSFCDVVPFHLQFCENEEIKLEPVYGA